MIRAAVLAVLAFLTVPFSDLVTLDGPFRSTPDINHGGNRLRSPELDISGNDGRCAGSRANVSTEPDTWGCRMTFEMSALLLTWVAMVLLALALGGVVRQVRILSGQARAAILRPDGPRVGSVLGSIPVGESDARRQVFVFLRANCPSCDALIPELVRSAAIRARLRLTAVFAAARPETELGSVDVMDHQSALFETLGISVTPYLVAISPERTVVEARPVGSVALLERVLRSLSEEVAEDGRILR